MYYNNELNSAFPIHNNYSIPKIKIQCGSNSTKYIDINIESIKALRAYIDAIEKKLIIEEVVR